MSLSEAIETAVQTESAPETTSTGTTTETTPESVVTAPEPSLIGLPEPKDAEVPAGTAWKFAEGVNPDTQVATDPEGKPIYARDVQASFFRQADYTRKTQEVALMRDQFPQAAEWFTKNGPVIDKINPLLDALTRNDTEGYNRVLAQMAQEAGVTLRSRDSQGRFSRQEEAQEPDLYDLDKIIEEGYGPGTAAYDMAERSNNLAIQLHGYQQKMGGLESKFDDFLGNVQAQQQQIQVQNRMNEVAQGWAVHGFQADTTGAMALVGKPMTADDAVMLHNFWNILDHNKAILEKRGGTTTPNTPAALGTQPKFPEGMSLSERLAAQFAR